MTAALLIGAVAVPGAVTRQVAVAVPPPLTVCGGPDSRAAVQPLGTVRDNVTSDRTGAAKSCTVPVSTVEPPVLMDAGTAVSATPAGAGWKTPAEALDDHLRSIQDAGVASTD